jgi:uncharacterized protein YwgA
MYMSNDHQAQWALALISTVDSIKGITRLQKYAFLTAKRIKDIVNRGFYNDWEPSHYGPFSKKLAQDVCNLENGKYITNETVSAGYDYTLGLVKITENGRQYIKQFVDDNKKYVNSIKKIVEPYQSQHLIDLLHDVYFSYPVFATNSKIKNKVGMDKFESDYFLNQNTNGCLK